MKFIPPSRLTFWRSVFALTGVLPFLALYQILGSAAKVGVDLSISRPWQGLVAGLALMGLLSLFLLALTFSRYRERVLSLVEFPDTTNAGITIKATMRSQCNGTGCAVPPCSGW